ncbi:MAG: hypothetical protein ACBR12_24295 [Microcoleus sp.]
MTEPTSSSSLQDYTFSPNYIATQIRMLRTDKQYSGSFLIAEGDTDARVWKRFVDSTKCRVEIAHNKDNAIKPTFRTPNWHIHGVRGQK